MFDSKVIRRRRAALAIFVVLSIGMLTVYFGESGGGVFHTLQRGAQAAFAPLETGASRALKPFRDLFGWFGDTFDAKGENEQLRAEVEQLRRSWASTRPLATTFASCERSSGCPRARAIPRTRTRLARG